MHMFELKLSTTILLALSSGIVLAGAQEGKSTLRCEAPEYFGICDTFVPGTVIGAADDYKPITVFYTLMDGPADRAGICPGDEIIEINGISVLQNTLQRMLKELVSDSATSVRLRVRRGQQQLDFSVPRVRESTLAYLTNQKFLRKRLVPLSQSLLGLEELDKFTSRKSEPVRLPSNVRNFKPPGIFPHSAQDYIVGVWILHSENPREAIVEYIENPSPAFEAGFHLGDRIEAVNGTPIGEINREKLDTLLAPTKSIETVFEVSRQGEKMRFRVTPVTWTEALAKVARKPTKLGPARLHCPDAYKDPMK